MGWQSGNEEQPSRYLLKEPFDKQCCILSDVDMDTKCTLINKVQMVLLMYIKNKCM